MYAILRAGRLPPAISRTVCECLAPARACQMGKNQRKFYAVRIGRQPGIYNSWEEAQPQVHGFRSAQFRSFRYYGEAQAYMGAEYAASGAVAHPAAIPSVPQLAVQRRTPGIMKPWRSARPAMQLPPLQYYSSQSMSDYASTHDAPLQILEGDLYRLEFDGGSRGNPGVAGAGAVIVHDTSDAQVGSICVPLGHATNNVAEYSALIQGMKAALACGIKRLRAQGDSKLVVEQVMGRWKVNNPGLQVLHEEVLLLMPQFDEFHAVHVYREQNTVADRLSNEAMDGRGWMGLKQGPGHIREISTLCCTNCGGPKCVFEDEKDEILAQSNPDATVHEQHTALPGAVHLNGPPAFIGEQQVAHQGAYHPGFAAVAGLAYAAAVMSSAGYYQ